MKIVMLCDFFNEALEYQENLLVKYYCKHGHEVTVITSTYESVFDYYADRHDNATPERRYENAGARIFKLRYRYNIRNKLRAFTSIAGILEQEAPDLIFVHDIMLNFPECVRYIKRHPGCRMIMDYHADYSNSGKNALSLKILHGVVRKWFLDQARPYLSRIFPIVPASATFLHEVYGVPLSDMEVLPLGADTDLGRTVRTAGARARLRAAYGMGANDLVIFTGGKLDPLKRTEALITAFKALPQAGLQLVVVGEAAAPQQIYKDLLVGLAGDAPNIRFTGWLSAQAIYEHLDLADIAVFPASQSILWQQAISMGLPLVIGDRAITGVQQDVSYLNEANNILVLNPVRPLVDELRDALALLIGDASLRQKMADGAALVTDRHLNWDTLIGRTLAPALSETTRPHGDSRPANQA